MFSLLPWPPAIAVVSAVDGVPTAVTLALLLLFVLMLILVAPGVLLLAVLLLPTSYYCSVLALAYRTAAICRTNNFSTNRDIQYQTGE
jgi:hypothetical protein